MRRLGIGSMTHNHSAGFGAAKTLAAPPKKLVAGSPARDRAICAPCKRPTTGEQHSKPDRQILAVDSVQISQLHG